MIFGKSKTLVCDKWLLSQKDLDFIPSTVLFVNEVNFDGVVTRSLNLIELQEMMKNYYQLNGYRFKFSIGLSDGKD